MAGPLPHPVTTTDELLAAVHEELVGLRADLAARFPSPAPATPGDDVVVTEPARPARRKPRTAATPDGS